MAGEESELEIVGNFKPSPKKTTVIEKNHLTQNTSERLRSPMDSELEDFLE